MRRTPVAIVFLAAVGLTLATVATSAASPTTDRASTLTEKVEGYFHGYPGDCPDDLPSTPLVCHEWDITVFRNGFGDEPGGVAPPHSRWVLLALRHTLTFAGDGSEPVESDVGFGFRDGADVTFDAEHLAFAAVRAPGLRLTDGSVVDLAATWTATAERAVYGNDSPVLAQYGLVHHLHGDCVNIVNQGHTKVRAARVSAVVNGVESSYDGAYAAISTGLYLQIEVHQDSCS
jgi:hypothetical protein